jgi:hypothetical protein
MEKKMMTRTTQTRQTTEKTVIQVTAERIITMEKTLKQELAYLHQEK